MKALRWSSYFLPFLAGASLAQAMPGMQMPAPAGGKHKQAASQHSAGPATPGMDMNPPSTAEEPPAREGLSITRDPDVQEPEDPARRTGSREPAPELLREVSARRSMTLDDFLALAEAKNPTLAQAKSRVTQSAAESRQAGLYPNPTVGFQGDQIRGGQYGGGEQGGYIQQTVVLGGKLGLRKAIYNQQRLADETAVDEQHYRVVNDVSQAFYDALTAQAMVVLRQRMAGLAQDAVETVHQLSNVGQADAPDVLQAEVESEQAKIAFVNAQRMYLGRFTALAALCGTPTIPAAPLNGRLEAPPEIKPEEQLRTLTEGSPGIRKLQLQVEVAEARLNDARREWIPDLDLKAGEQYNFEQLGGAAGSRPVGPQSFASAALGLPLWNRNQGRVAAARAAVEQARADVVREQLRLQSNATPLAQSYLSATYAAERYRTQIIPRAQRAYELYLNKYQSMAMAYPQVLVSQRTLFEVQLQYLSALREVWRDAVALQNFSLSGALDGAASDDLSPAGLNRSIPE